jgi:nucleoside-diphosphate-sugar epimerase
MRILIVGGTNFIGPPLVWRLVEFGHDVALFHRHPAHAERLASVRHITGDRRRLADHREAFRQFSPDIVVDMIAYTEDDAQGLIAAFRGLARRAVVISSIDVCQAYGRFIGTESGPIQPTPLTENSTLRSVLFPYCSQAASPDDFLYSYDKIPVERTVMAEPDLPATILRLPMTYGPGDPFHRLSPYLQRMDAARPAIRLDEGLARWKCPRGYVENVGAAIALAIEDDRAMGRIYHLAEEPAFSEIEWVRRIGEAAGWRGDVATVPTGRIPVPYDFRQNIDANAARIRRELGYAEVVGLDQALQRTIAWERANPPDQPSAVGILDDESENP